MKTLKYGEVHRNDDRDLKEARATIQVFIEKVYNQRRLDSAIGYVPRTEFEANLIAQQNVVSPVDSLALARQWGQTEATD